MWEPGEPISGIEKEKSYLPFPHKGVNKEDIPRERND
jgi:hypothetical protein